MGDIGRVVFDFDDPRSVEKIELFSPYFDTTKDEIIWPSSVQTYKMDYLKHKQVQVYLMLCIWDCILKQ